MSGQNTIIFEPLNGDASATGNLYDACTLTVTDIAGNISLILNITPFVVDTVVPTAAVTYTTTTRTNQDVIVTLS